ncbi:hypothetical protein [Tenacibaculum sp. SG-28]|uniref:hypothetical protein n=1 Tax=Tenacibaculum sp. SG-28 TaxID=754426 RepID=UPI000CF4B5FF|nr:hypothetical protein [Tenacibaculum sp. SG-28]PQJ23257.1 hypothetical protein BSU00_03310 [Tenacibaculum sp. SG-28]
MKCKNEDAGDEEQLLITMRIQEDLMECKIQISEVSNVKEEYLKIMETSGLIEKPVFEKQKVFLKIKKLLSTSN